MIYDVFVSHKFESKEIVTKICDFIKSKRPTFKMWIDSSNMTVGDNLDGEIARGIDNSLVFVAFLTKEYCMSRYCQMEFKYAHDKNKPVIEVMLDKDTVMFDNDPAGIRLYTIDVLRINAYFHHRDKLIHEVCEKLINAIDDKLDKLKVSYYTLQESLFKNIHVHSYFNYQMQQLSFLIFLYEVYLIRKWTSFYPTHGVVMLINIGNLTPL